MNDDSRIIKEKQDGAFVRIARSGRDIQPQISQTTQKGKKLEQE